MKKHINISQLNELSDKGKKRLSEWWEPQEGDKFLQYKEKNKVSIVGGYEYQYEDGIVKEDVVLESLPLLNIGQMIEFLEDNKGWRDGWYDFVFEGSTILQGDPDESGYISTKYKGELCDALWSQCKEILERE